MSVKEIKKSYGEQSVDFFVSFSRNEIHFTLNENEAVNIIAL